MLTLTPSLTLTPTLSLTLTLTLSPSKITLNCRPAFYHLPTNEATCSLTLLLISMTSTPRHLAYPLLGLVLQDAKEA